MIKQNIIMLVKQHRKIILYKKYLMKHGDSLEKEPKKKTKSKIA